MAKRPTHCAKAIALVFDQSESLNPGWKTEWEMQLEETAKVFEDPEIIALIRANQSVAFSILSFNDQAYIREPWYIAYGEGGAAYLSTALRTLAKAEKPARTTNMAEALSTAHQYFSYLPKECVGSMPFIDVASDGATNDDRATMAARDHVAQTKIHGRTAIINGVGIGDGSTFALREHVVSTDGQVFDASSPGAFKAMMKAKLWGELVAGSQLTPDQILKQFAESGVAFSHSLLNERMKAANLTVNGQGFIDYKGRHAIDTGTTSPGRGT